METLIFFTYLLTPSFDSPISPYNSLNLLFSAYSSLFPQILATVISVSLSGLTPRTII